MIVAGNGVYDRCRACGQLVRLNKTLFGSLHFCLTDEELRAKRGSQLLHNQLNIAAHPKATQTGKQQ